MSGAGTMEANRPHSTPPDARTAASVLFLREGEPGLEVLMMVRGERANDHRSGAAVFPGGAVDPRDRLAWPHSVGADDAAISARMGLVEGGLDYLVAAVRESFEEAGLLLADRLFEAARLHEWRTRLNRGEVAIDELCATHGFKLDLSGLVYYSHWLTPPGPLKRFDTRFFVVDAPEGQEPRADNNEAVQLMWLTPAQALSAELDLKLMPVTRRTLQDLARHARPGTVIDEARTRATVPMIMPRRVWAPKGHRVIFPESPAYAEVGRLDPDGLHHPHGDIQPGRVVRLSPNVVRITAPNAGPMTGPGTNSYLVGAGSSWNVIDPGPDMPEHLEALKGAVQSLAPDARLERIFVTHTHRDHSPAARPLAEATGAQLVGWRTAVPEWQDATFEPTHAPVHGERFMLAPGVTLRTLHTPGHASNHLCWLFEEEKLLFTGDHVMAGSTVVINPPDGDMQAYLKALEALLGEDLEWFAPGHGFLVAQPHAVVRGLIAHRLKREDKVVKALAARGEASVDELVTTVYDDVVSAMHGMAKRSLLAHLVKLGREGRARDEGGRWRHVGST